VNNGFDKAQDLKNDIGNDGDTATHLNEGNLSEDIEGISIDTNVHIGVVPSGCIIPVPVNISNHSKNTIGVYFKSADCSCLSNVSDNLQLLPNQKEIFELRWDMGNQNNKKTKRKALLMLVGDGFQHDIVINIDATTAISPISPNIYNLGHFASPTEISKDFSLSDEKNYSIQNVIQTSGPNQATIILSDLLQNSCSRFYAKLTIPNISGSDVS
jgi:hypothetical protein